MAPLKFKKLVSYSSEDPLFPASNLLNKGKWKCKDEGEKQAWVLLQLEETSTITNIDIGNNGAAFIEVQVGRLGTDPDQMKVLLVASSFMSVNEARVGDNMGRVRMFGPDKLSPDTSKEKWDLVKVILTQPFTKLLRYGLSFVSLTGPAKPNITSEIKLGAFKLKEDKSEEISVGSYFVEKKIEDSKTPPPKAPSVAATLRDTTTVDNREIFSSCLKESIDNSNSLIESFNNSFSISSDKSVDETDISFIEEESTESDEEIDIFDSDEDSYKFRELNSDEEKKKYLEKKLRVLKKYKDSGEQELKGWEINLEFRRRQFKRLTKKWPLEKPISYEARKVKREIELFEGFIEKYNNIENEIFKTKEDLRIFSNDSKISDSSKRI